MKKIKKIANWLVITVFTIHFLTGCGTILHPERKGQSGGRLDPAIVVLDAVGLLFFIIPGVIAFAVDFSNGTIYLPGSSSENKNSDSGSTIIKVDGKIDKAVLESIIQERYHLAVNLDDKSTVIERIDSLDESQLFAGKL